MPCSQKNIEGINMNSTFGRSLRDIGRGGEGEGEGVRLGEGDD